MGECNKETTFQILDHFYTNGGNFIDTANMYMNGESEIWLGEWMSLRQNRNETIIATKYTSPVQMLSTNPSNAILSNEGGNNKKSLRLSLETSLKNLKTDYVDVFYVHAWEGLASIPELMRALDDVVRAGKVLYIGVSNWPAWIVVKANEYARQHGLTPFVVFEGRWNLAERKTEREILPMCQAEGIGITVWGALGAGKFKSKEQKDESGGRSSIRDLGGASLESFERFAVVMGDIGKRKGTDAIAVALRYIMLKTPYIFPIVGGRTVQHLKHNIEALELDLSEDDIDDIESAVPFDFGYPHSFL